VEEEAPWQFVPCPLETETDTNALGPDCVSLSIHNKATLRLWLHAVVLGSHNHPTPISALVVEVGNVLNLAINSWVPPGKRRIKIILSPTEGGLNMVD